MILAITDFSHALSQGAAHAWFFIPSAILLGALHGLEPGAFQNHRWRPSSSRFAERWAQAVLLRSLGRDLALAPHLASRRSRPEVRLPMEYEAAALLPTRLRRACPRSRTVDVLAYTEREVKAAAAHHHGPGHSHRQHDESKLINTGQRGMLPSSPSSRRSSASFSPSLLRARPGIRARAVQRHRSQPLGREMVPGRPSPSPGRKTSSNRPQIFQSRMNSMPRCALLALPAMRTPTPSEFRENEHGH